MGKHRSQPKTSRQVGKGGNTKPTTPKPPPATTNSGWIKSPNSSPRFNLLMRKDVSDLTVAHLNVEKIGKFKRKELAEILHKYDIDCLGIVEHQIGSSDFDDNTSETKFGHKSLEIKGYKVASKHREKASGGVAWFWKKDLNAEVWENTSLPNDLVEASRERCWIKIQGKTSPFHNRT